MRKRLVIVVVAVVSLMGLAPTADAGTKKDPWLCIANRDANVGACLYDPL